MISYSGKQISAIQILPKYQQIKVIILMKYGLLMEYIIRNILIGKSYTKCGGGTSPRPFAK